MTKPLFCFGWISLNHATADDIVCVCVLLSPPPAQPTLTMLRGFVDQNHKPPQLPFRRDVMYYTAFVLFPPALRLQTKLHRLYSCQVVASLRYYRSCIAFSFSMH